MRRIAARQWGCNSQQRRCAGIVSVTNDRYCDGVNDGARQCLPLRVNTLKVNCGSFMCQISAARSWRRSVTRNRKRTPVMVRLRLQMLAPLSTRCSWKRRTSSAVAVSGERLSQVANRLQLEMWLRLRVRVELARSHVFDHTLTQRTDRVGLAHRALLPE